MRCCKYCATHAYLYLLAPYRFRPGVTSHIRSRAFTSKPTSMSSRNTASQCTNPRHSGHHLRKNSPRRSTQPCELGSRKPRYRSDSSGHDAVENLSFWRRLSFIGTGKTKVKRSSSQPSKSLDEDAKTGDIRRGAAMRRSLTNVAMRDGRV